MVAGPLDKGLDEDIYKERISLSSEKKTIAEFFQKNYEWVIILNLFPLYFFKNLILLKDILAARGVWAFGPDAKYGANILIDDTLPKETNKKLLYSVKEPIIQGNCGNSRLLMEHPRRPSLRRTHQKCQI